MSRGVLRGLKIGFTSKMVSVYENWFCRQNGFPAYKLVLGMKIVFADEMGSIPENWFHW